MTRLLLPLALPVAGLVLLLARPKLDVHWEQHPAHFWLVLGTALVSVVLGYLGAKAKSAVPALRGLLNDPEERVKLRAMSALGCIGPDAKAAVPLLVELAKDEK